MANTEAKLVPAADKTLKIIEYMAQSRNSDYGVTEIATALGYNKGTVYPILQTLIANHWVERSPHTGKYCLTNKINLLSEKSGKANRLVSDFLLIGNEMERKCGELINLHYLKFMSSTHIIAKVDSTQHSLRVDFPIGAMIPVIASSAGKCLICEMSDNTLTKIFEQCGKHYTSSTIRSEEKFRNEIYNVRKNGFAVNNAEYEDGIFSIAAPVRGFNGAIIAAINIVVPATRYTMDREQFLIDLVRDGAGKLSFLHGYQE